MFYALMSQDNQDTADDSDAQILGLFIDLYKRKIYSYIHNVVFSATDILHLQRSLIGCSQA